MKLLILTAILVSLIVVGCMGCIAKEKPLKLDFTCLSTVTKDGVVRSDCADQETWDAFREKVMRERGL